MTRTFFYTLHILVVVIFVLLAITGAAIGTEPAAMAIADSALFHGGLLALFYWSYSMFIPRFPVQRKGWLFAGSILLLVAGYTLAFVLAAYLLSLIPGTRWHLMNTALWGTTAIFAIIVGMAGTFMRLFVVWMQDAINKKEMEKQQVKSELSMLKNQLNPHFLFNTLNNIDALIIEQSPNASAALNRLSALMRYMVYDASKEVVPLADEISYLRDYVSLQKLRIPNEDIIQMEVHGNTDGIQIAPVLFIPFIENAFKHSSLKDDPKNQVKIKLEVNGNKLLFVCSNRIGQVQKDHTSGVGLNIVKRRLDLLYKDRYLLVVDKNDETYRVSLSINLS